MLLNVIDYSFVVFKAERVFSLVHVATLWTKNNCQTKFEMRNEIIVSYTFLIKHKSNVVRPWIASILKLMRRRNQHGVRCKIFTKPSKLPMPISVLLVCLFV